MKCKIQRAHAEDTGLNGRLLYRLDVIARFWLERTDISDYLWAKDLLEAKEKADEFLDAIEWTRSSTGRDR